MAPEEAAFPLPLWTRGLQWLCPLGVQGAGEHWVQCIGYIGACPGIDVLLDGDSSGNSL